jgi:Uma2 family endonuclease
MPVDLPKRTFTVGDYYKMAEAGIFERERVELVEGEVVKMTPLGSRHAACVTRLNRLFSRLLGQEALLRVQDPVRISDRTELEPDLAVVRYRRDFYAGAHPTPVDTLLVVEVSDSSLAYDRDVKMPIYARAGIPSAWLIDLAGQEVTVHSGPTAEGYGHVAAKVAGDQLTLAVPGSVFEVNVADLLA